MQQQIETLIKNKIKQKGLVKTGSLLNSIKVTVGSDFEIKIKANDYFEYLNEEHNILGEVMASQEFTDLIENYIGAQIEGDLDII